MGEVLSIGVKGDLWIESKLRGTMATRRSMVLTSKVAMSKVACSGLVAMKGVSMVWILLVRLLASSKANSVGCEVSMYLLVEVLFRTPLLP